MVTSVITVFGKVIILAAFSKVFQADIELFFKY